MTKARAQRELRRLVQLRVKLNKRRRWRRLWISLSVSAILVTAVKLAGGKWLSALVAGTIIGAFLALPEVFLIILSIFALVALLTGESFDWHLDIDMCRDMSKRRHKLDTMIANREKVLSAK